MYSCVGSDPLDCLKLLDNHFVGVYTDGVCSNIHNVVSLFSNEDMYTLVLKSCCSKMCWTLYRIIWRVSFQFTIQPHKSIVISFRNNVTSKNRADFMIVEVLITHEPVDMSVFNTFTRTFCFMQFGDKGWELYAFVKLCERNPR